MKNLFLPFIIIVLIITISCEENKNDPEMIVDPLIGSWTIFGIENAGIPAILNECELTSTLTFVAPNILSAKNIEFNETETKCIVESEGMGTWRNVDSSTYELTAGGETTLLLSVMFSDNDKTLVFTVVQDGEDNQVFIYKK